MDKTKITIGLTCVLCLKFLILNSHELYASTINTQKSSLKKKGILIVGAGISGSGKSTTFRELNKLIGGKLFLEPEEDSIFPLLLDRKYCDDFTLIMGFRSLRVPQLMKASKLRDEGKMVLVDSYFNKIMYFYINNEGFEWLMSPISPYIKSLTEILKLDMQMLPNADAIVLFDISYDTWKKFLEKRGRNSDKNPSFLKSYENFKDIENAVNRVARMNNIKVIKFKQSYSSPKIQAQELKDLLVKNGIIDNIQ